MLLISYVQKFSLSQNLNKSLKKKKKVKNQNHCTIKNKFNTNPLMMIIHSLFDSFEARYEQL